MKDSTQRLIDDIDRAKESAVADMDFLTAAHLRDLSCRIKKASQKIDRADASGQCGTENQP